MLGLAQLAGEATARKAREKALKQLGDKGVTEQDLQHFTGLMGAVLACNFDMMSVGNKTVGWLAKQCNYTFETTDERRRRGDRPRGLQR